MSAPTLKFGDRVRNRFYSRSVLGVVVAVNVDPARCSVGVEDRTIAVLRGRVVRYHSPHELDGPLPAKVPPPLGHGWRTAALQESREKLLGQRSLPEMQALITTPLLGGKRNPCYRKPETWAWTHVDSDRRTCGVVHSSPVSWCPAGDSEFWSLYQLSGRLP